MSTPLSLDLGSSYLRLGLRDPHKGLPRMLVLDTANPGGTLPAYFAPGLSKGLVIGSSGAALRGRSPVYSLADVKRLFGLAAENSHKNQNRFAAPWQWDEAKQAWLRLEHAAWKPDEILGIFLQALQAEALALLKQAPESVVVTVPIYFSPASCARLLVLIREKFGVPVALMSDSLAAAHAYSFCGGTKKIVAIYHLGAGNFEFALVDLSHAEPVVLAEVSDPFLGGDHFDHQLAKRLAAEIKKRSQVDLMEEGVSADHVRMEAERGKRALTYRGSTDVKIMNRGKHVDYSVAISSFELKALVQDLIDQSLNLCQQACRQAGLEPGKVEDFMLAGGMTRMPAVRQAVETFFGKHATLYPNPDEVTVIGALRPVKK